MKTKKSDKKGGVNGDKTRFRCNKTVDEYVHKTAVPY